ncbi:acylphosphatase-2-like [Cololabis saira]|uniref:acylphosphatase-2-like n=1 Tax=Cololabis saira TaxID=129043 RepID=UPI002AD26761|nr:acylphosphatase-2-like [Cololabis saira]
MTRRWSPEESQRKNLQGGFRQFSLFLLLLLFLLRAASSCRMSAELVSVDFEVFGHVQGVCFRMYTEQEGLRLGLVGWVKNTSGGTVVGQVQGPAGQVEEMKVWLSKEGSPSSRITRTSFSNRRTIDKLELSGFSTRF